MKQACRPFASSTLPDHLKNVTATAVPDDLKAVAEAFISLQQARHEADYNVSRTFSRTNALAEHQRASEAFAAWRWVRDRQIATVFLVNLLLGSKWKRGA